VVYVCLEREFFSNPRKETVVVSDTHKNNTYGRVHDLGGHDVARELWADYFTAVNAIVYLVDCNDRDRFPEAKSELDKLLQNDQLQGVPFLILGNKIDMQRAASEPELRQALGLQHYLTGKVSTLLL
jgi:GTP-binding protein SAR1